MNKNALFVGLNVIDIQFFVDKFPTSNQKIKTAPPYINVGGPAANAAIAFSFLGGNTTFVTCVGSNAFTSYVYGEYEKYSVKLHDIVEKNDVDPVIATVITTTNSGERSIISSFPSQVSVPDNLIEYINWDDLGIVVVDGFYPEIAIPVCEAAREKNIPVVYDGGSWKPSSPEMLPHIDIAICSEQFFPPACKEISDVFDFLRSKGIHKIAITRGEKSIYYSEDKSINSIPVDHIDSIDSLGAGDIFHGAFSWFYLKNNNFEQALKQASKVATFSTLFKGPRQWMKHYYSEFSF